MHLTLQRFVSAIRKDRISAAALAAAALIGTTIVLSCFWVPVLGHERARGGFYADWMIANGVLVYERVDARTMPDEDDREWGFTLRAMDNRSRREFDGYFLWRTLGFSWFHPHSPGWDSTLLTIPLWLPAAAFVLVCVVRCRRALKRLRFLDRGCCPSCGYDLRATPGRCPECGTMSVSGIPAASDVSTVR